MDIFGVLTLVGGLALFGWHLLSGAYYVVYLFLTDGVL